MKARRRARAASTFTSAQFAAALAAGEDVERELFRLAELNKETVTAVVRRKPAEQVDLTRVPDATLERLRASLQRAHDRAGGEIVRRISLGEP